MDFIRQYTQAVIGTLERLPWSAIEQVIACLHEARLRRATVFVCGNGGSAATASHMVNDLNKGAMAAGVPRFRAIGLTDNVPLLTAWSNDACYADAFVEPLRNLARPGDVLVGISGSGNSANVLNAMRFAREIGMTTIGLIGCQGGKLVDLVDLAVIVPNACMEQIEDVHMFLEHAIISALRDKAQRELVPSVLLAEGYSFCALGSGANVHIPPRAAVFLDRDGVINANRADYVKGWDELVLLPGALEALRALAELRLPLVIVTNQSAINRHLVSFEVAESINRRLMALIGAHGGRVDAMAWCPHTPEEQCRCRKPEPGLLTHTAGLLNLDLARSYVVGDAESDIAAGIAAGCKTLLVLTGRGDDARVQVEACWGARCQVVPDLAAAVRWISEDYRAVEHEHA